LPKWLYHMEGKGAVNLPLLACLLPLGV
jgi:hypothetical protein